MAAHDFPRLSDIEFTKLTVKLQKGLKQDIARIYRDSLFCDLELVLGKSSLHLNCCLLEVRAKSFYAQLCSLQQLFSKGCNLDISTVERIQNFVRDIYECDDLSLEEALLVEHLKHPEVSPDFDQYATPLTSPLECFNEEKSSVIKPDQSYYSLVPLDWEKELAEQDFLIESFCAILQKEQTKKKLKPQKLPSLNLKKYCKQQNSRSLLDLKRAVEEDSILIQEEDNFRLNESVTNISNKSFESKCKKIKCSIIHHVNRELDFSLNECRYFDAEDSTSLCYESLVDRYKIQTVKSKMSSNMDAGPDSGLATSAEDIPLEQESGLEVSKSISSSLSSDCCVWDSSGAPLNTDVASWVDQAPHPDSTNVEADFVDRVLEELVGKSQSQNQRHVLSQVAESSAGLGAPTTPKHGFFIDASSLLDETEIAAAKAEVDSEGRKSAPNCPIMESCVNLESGRTEKWQANRKSCVSSLPLIEENRVTNSCGDRMASGSEAVGPRGENDSHVENVVRLHSCQEDDKPPSLIRSNTFELETEDDRLALLRQDFERRQGSLIFQRCLSQSSGPLSDGGSEHDLNQHCTSLILPDLDPTLAMANMSLFPTHVVDDQEIQTPDSLNNDLPGVPSMDTFNISRSEYEDTQLPNEKDLNNTMSQSAVESRPLDLKSQVKSDAFSPLFSRRKTDSAPILSGAAPPLSPEKMPLDKKVRNPLVSSVSSAWVVDISDLTNSPEVRRRKGDSSLDTSISDPKDELSASETKSSSSSLGFFIDLKNPQLSLDDKCDSIPKIEESKISRQSSDSGKNGKQNACEFFVDLKHSSAPQKQPPKSELIQGAEKKLFSMFIDFGEKSRPKTKPELSSRSRTPLSPFSTRLRTGSEGVSSEGVNCKAGRGEAEQRGDKQDSSTLSPSSASAIQNNDPKKNSFYMFIDSEPRNQKGSPPNRSAVVQNIQDSKEKITSRNRHVRASSVSCDKISPNILLNSQSLQNVEMTGDNDDPVGKAMFASYHASLPIEETREEKTHKSQEEFGEGSDISCQMTTGSNGSSACSLETYSVHTPDQSSATDNHSSEKRDEFQSNKEGVVSEEQTRESNMKLLQWSTAKSKKGGVSSKSETKLKLESKTAKSFVRLSDLDKEPIDISDQTAPSAGHRMSRSIPETSWIESKLLMSQSMGGGPVMMSSSSRSLSRLFPHLPMHSGNLGRSKTSSSCSPFTDDFDTMRSSQVSDLSSMQSSTGLEYSTESTDISSDRVSPATQLGDDLLKMFLEGINTDVIVEVGGRRIKAHKCILSSRCQYFAAGFSGGWVESAGNVISLQGFSYTVVHFALCHIYSGASTIPDQISIVELASLADMLSLEGLKDVIMYTLKVKYCHFFHKPCAVCSVGVLECLPLAAAYGLDDIYRKSLRWITKYFVRIWPTKTFTALPRELMEKCYQQHIIHMTAENVLETILCCDKLLSTIPTVRWAEPVFVLTSRLMEMCIKFMSENFSAVMSSDNFLSMGKEVPWNVGRFQESLVSACERMPPDQACRSYKQLHSVLEVVQGPDPPPEMTWHPNFVELLVHLYELSERTLIKQAARAARTPGWGQMPTELRRKIQDAACLVLAPADHASSRYKRNIGDGVRQSNHQSSYSRNLDLHQVKMAMAQHARRTNNNNNNTHTLSTVVVRKNIPTDRSNTVARRSAPVATIKTTERSTSVPSQGRPKTWPAQVKSRYLEKRPNHCKQTIDSQEGKKRLDAPVLQRRVPPPVKNMFISSSDSSRNSSPAMKRSSNVVSSSSKLSESSSRTRAATVCNSSASRLEASTNWKEDGISKSSDNIARRSLPNNVKPHSVMESTKTPPTVRKVKDSTSPEVPFQAKQDAANSQTPSTLGTHSQSITMSNDSLATVSSSDDAHLTHSEKSQETKSRKLIQNISSRTHTNGLKKSDVNSPRTPLILANKKASSSSVLKEAPLLKSKTAVSNNIGTTRTPLSLLTKRSLSQNVKSPILSISSSRLAIPLRTSKSVSSVPDKGQSKVNVGSEALSSRKQTLKDQPARNISASSKRASTGSSNVATSSIAGRVSSSKGSKINNGESKSSKPRINDKANGDSSLGSEHPTVGPRSGTFLKDEPTILKAPVVDNA